MLLVVGLYIVSTGTEKNYLPGNKKYITLCSYNTLGSQLFIN